MLCKQTGKQAEIKKSLVAIYKIYCIYMQTLLPCMYSTVLWCIMYSIHKHDDIN